MKDLIYSKSNKKLTPKEFYFTCKNFGNNEEEMRNEFLGLLDADYDDEGEEYIWNDGEKVIGDKIIVKKFKEGPFEGKFHFIDDQNNVFIYDYETKNITGKVVGDKYIPLDELDENNKIIIKQT